jgi:hypothetical protein
MKSLLLLACLGLTACASSNRLVYSNGFSFGNYDAVVIAKPAGPGDALFGMDVEFGNLLGEYDMRLVGDKEYETLPADAKARTLVVHVGYSASDKRSLLSITFDDAATGKTVATVTAIAKGDMLDPDDRKDALENVSKAIVAAIAHDKGLSVSG